MCLLRPVGRHSYVSSFSSSSHKTDPPHLLLPLLSLLSFLSLLFLLLHEQPPPPDVTPPITTTIAISHMPNVESYHTHLSPRTHPRIPTQSLSLFSYIYMAECIVIPATIKYNKMTVECNQGDVFTITGRDDVEGARGSSSLFWKLPCVFAAGIVPTAVPLGEMRGTLLHPGIPNIINDYIYHGHYSTQTVCQGHVTHLTQLSLSPGFKPTAGFVHIGVPAGEFIESEYFDGRPGVLKTYVDDFIDRCGSEGQTLKPLFFAPYKQKQIPFAPIFNDLSRIVGMDTADGGTFLLERAAIKDANQEGINKWTTLAYVLFKSFDPSLLADRPNPLAPTEPFSIGPLPSSFTTKFAGAPKELAYRLITSAMLYPYRLWTSLLPPELRHREETSFDANNSTIRDVYVHMSDQHELVYRHIHEEASFDDVSVIREGGGGDGVGRSIVVDAIA
eukprot:GHVQ01016385.1.p1 GENE.GHVQ01016385.1~~GHVQ01016385.1.p1  ORF type:complete len:446 (+),score=72.25 GHVQ01016385.1:753-2090(+)